MADYPRHIRCGPPGSTEPMYGSGDLVLALAGTESNFLSKLFDLIAKARSTPHNFERLRVAFPPEVRAWEIWQPSSPAPTGDELLDLLTAEGYEVRRG